MEEILFKSAFECGEVTPSEMEKYNYELGVEPTYGAGTIGEPPEPVYDVDNLPQEAVEDED